MLVLAPCQWVYNLSERRTYRFSFFRTLAALDIISVSFSLKLRRARDRRNPDQRTNVNISLAVPRPPGHFRFEPCTKCRGTVIRGLKQMFAEVKQLVYLASTLL